LKCVFWIKGAYAPQIKIAFPSYFRPIFLVSMALKILNKLFANRLQEKIIPFLHQNQYGFIKSKTIQDCLIWAFEYLPQYQGDNYCETWLSKDIIYGWIKIHLNHAEAHSFVDKWITWIDVILNSAPTSIILNGVPRKQSICQCSVRQGEPLSPLLFVAKPELLQIVTNHAWQEGQLYLLMNHLDKAILSYNMLMILYSSCHLTPTN
jgi:hypothetical protein